VNRTSLLKSLAIFLGVVGISGNPSTIAHEVPLGQDVEVTADTEAPPALTEVSDQEVYETGRIDVIQVDPGRASQYFSLPAENANHTARPKLASMLLDGRGTILGPPTAVEIPEELSEGDDAQATISLAKSLVEDFRRQTASADADKDNEHPRNDMIGTALLSLGDLYMDGKIDSAAGEVAFDYYLDLLESGAQVVAAIQPGDLIPVNETGVFAPNRVAAERAYLKAAGVGQPEAYLRLSDLYKNRSGTALDEDKAVASLKKAVDLNNQNAVVELRLFEIERNEDAATLRAAFSDLDALARLGNTNAQFGLGRLLLTRSKPGQQPDPDRAVSLIQRAAKDGHAGAILLLAQIQIYGSIVPRNPTIGLLSLQQLADAGFADAMLALGDVFSDGVDGTLSRDPALAFRYYTQAADAGSNSAVTRMAGMLLRGEGVSRDMTRGLALLEQSARAGSASALVEMGAIYRDGGTEGVARDAVRAFGYFRQAADLGDLRATLEAALMQLDGPAEIANPEAAVARLTSLAMAGDVGAAYHLAEYHAGVGDPALAFRYYTQAADAGSNSAVTRMAGMLLRGEGVSRDVTRGLALLEQGARAGSASALVEMGAIYRDGGTEGVARDAVRAFGYFRQAADQGDLRATLEAALMQLDGPAEIANPEAAVARLTSLAMAGDVGAAYHLAEYHAGVGDPALAFRYYTQAADAGSNSAVTRMAGMLLRGEGVSRDVTRGLALLEQSARGGSASALVEMGDAYARGKTGSVDITAALEAYKAAAKLGNTVALVRLADIYRYGLLSTKSKSQAFEYLERAVEQGNEYAQYMMGQALIDGEFGSARKAREGIDLLVRGARSGNPDAAAALAVLDWGVPDGMFSSNNKIDRLHDLAAAGNIAASLKLVEAYRVGHGGRKQGITSQNLVMARKELDRISKRIDPAEYEIQRLLLDLKTARRADFPNLFKRIKKLAPSERPGAIRRVLQVSPNAFVYLVQLQLAEEGYYNGTVNGLMTSSTITAIQGLCKSLNAKSLCRHGPLSPQAYTLLFYAF
jgi:TPR repeat protein